MQATDRESTTVELGPRSMALLRRLVQLLEVQTGVESYDPGKPSEVVYEQPTEHGQT